MQIARQQVPRHRRRRLRRLARRRPAPGSRRGRGRRARPRPARRRISATRSRAGACGSRPATSETANACAEVFEGVDGALPHGGAAARACTQDPRRCLEVNVVGTFNVFEAAREAGVKKIVFSSASSRLRRHRRDDGRVAPARRAHDVRREQDLPASTFLRAFGDADRLEYVILRYMNVYGPRQERRPRDGVLDRDPRRRAADRSPATAASRSTSCTSPTSPRRTCARWRPT